MSETDLVPAIKDIINKLTPAEYDTFMKDLKGKEVEIKDDSLKNIKDVDPEQIVEVGNFEEFKEDLEDAKELHITDKEGNVIWKFVGDKEIRDYFEDMELFRQNAKTLRLKYKLKLLSDKRKSKD